LSKYCLTYNKYIMSTKKSQSIGLRVEESLKETLEIIAKRETRSVSQQVEHFVRQGIREYVKNNPELDVEQNSNSSKKTTTINA
jgi:hypothetical protein